MFFQQGEGGKIYPFLTAILDVHHGEVKGITWDDACLFCGKDRCVENTYDYNGNLGNQELFKQPTKACYLTEAECNTITQNGETTCDLMVYVVWTGTDVDGRVLQSSAFRYSAFPVQDIQNQISQLLPDIPFFGSVPGSTPEGSGEATPEGSGAA